DTELRVIWTLIAHELCLQCRSLLRDLDGGTSLDPTSDALRRAVYSARRDARVTWSELAADGALRRFGLIERTDTGAATPLYRQTWKIAERVLALAHGELTLDPTLAHIAAQRAV